MAGLPTIYCKRIRAALRYMAVVALVLAVIAPKVSLALSSVMGTGYQSVIICTGTGLTRVMLSPSGQIVDDVTSELVTTHCVPASDHTQSLHRRWQAVSFDDASPAFSQHDEAVRQWLDSRLTPITNRGPPTF